MDAFEVLHLVVSNLDKVRVPYMVGGSFASSLYGFARSTQDIDVIVTLRPDQTEDFVKLFQRDFYVDRSLIGHALQTTSAFNVIHLESSFKVDLFFLGSRSYDREQFSRRKLQALRQDPEFLAYIQTPEDTLLSKLEWYRRGNEVAEAQWRDVIGVLKAQAESIDLDYLRRWAPELGVDDLLENAWREAGI